MQNLRHSGTLSATCTVVPETIRKYLIIIQGQTVSAIDDAEHSGKNLAQDESDC